MFIMMVVLMKIMMIMTANGLWLCLFQLVHPRGQCLDLGQCVALGSCEQALNVLAVVMSANGL